MHSMVREYGVMPYPAYHTKPGMPGWKGRIATKRNCFWAKAAACILAVFLLCFSVPTALALPPSSQQEYQGIDVSQWQGRIDFAAVKEAGVQVVYIRSSLGGDYTDPRFQENYKNAKAQGLKVGFYHYVTASNEEQARQEAQFFATVVAGTEPDCRLAMDFEYLQGLSRQEINRVALAFLEELERLTGHRPAVYTNTSMASTVYSKALAQYPLWVAQWGASNPADNGVWESWSGFQYSDAGRIPGISSAVDLDRFTDGIFLPESGEIPKPEEPCDPSHTVTITYVVRTGDTLSSIAAQHHTTVEKIVRLNELENPDLIFTGQKLLICMEKDPGTGECTVIYTVRTGDTLSGIASRYNTTLAQIVQKNGLKNPDLIYTGQRLEIPVCSMPVQPPEPEEPQAVRYTVRTGDTLSGIAARYRTTVPALVQLNHIKNPDLIYAGQVLVISPGGSSKQVVVKTGDTLWGIAVQNRTTVAVLAGLNAIKPPYYIYTGQIIQLP